MSGIDALRTWLIRAVRKWPNMDREGGWISLYYFPGRVIIFMGITSRGITVWLGVFVCGDESRRRGRWRKSDKVRYEEIFSLFTIIKYDSFQLVAASFPVRQEIGPLHFKEWFPISYLSNNMQFLSKECNVKLYWKFAGGFQTVPYHWKHVKNGLLWNYWQYFH